jgi:hypothetical protein
VSGNLRFSRYIKFDFDHAYAASMACNDGYGGRFGKVRLWYQLIGSGEPCLDRAFIKLTDHSGGDVSRR